MNQTQRHKFLKTQYRVKNGNEYDQALQQRGSLTVWVTPEAVATWQALPSGKRGRSRSYSDVAIETGHLLRLVFRQPWRQTEGLLRSIVTLLDVGIEVPDHTTFSRRSVALKRVFLTLWADCRKIETLRLLHYPYENETAAHESTGDPHRNDSAGS